MTLSVSFFLQLLATGGVGTALIAVLKALVNRLMGRRRAKVDTAEVVQGMALGMITPFEERLKKAEMEVDTLRDKIRALNVELDEALAGRRAAEDRLLQYGVPIPTSTDGGR